MSADLSIVIPNLDSPWVGETVAAIEAAGRGLDYEIVVVGRDGPDALAGASGVRLIETEEALSPAAARNLGVARSDGRIILFTDADCQPHPTWITGLVEALDHSPVAGGGVSFDLDANRWAVADNIASFHGLLADRPAEASTTAPLGSLNLGLRREAWEEVGEFDETLVTSEDHDWFFRARKAGLDCAFAPNAIVTHAAVRRSRADLTAHAKWYGRHFNAFRRKHPGVFDDGFTWKSAARLRAFALLKSWTSALSIFRSHPSLRPAIRALPGVALFRRTWYKTVADNWNRSI